MKFADAIMLGFEGNMKKLSWKEIEQFVFNSMKFTTTQMSTKELKMENQLK